MLSTPWMLRSAPAVGGATLCGAAATGAHNTGTPSVASDVRAMKVVDAGGAIRRLTTDAELAPWRMSLGLLGVAVELELQLVACRPYELRYRALRAPPPTWFGNVSFWATPSGTYYEERVVERPHSACAGTAARVPQLDGAAFFASRAVGVPPFAPFVRSWTRRIDEPRTSRHQRHAELVPHLEAELYVDAALGARAIEALAGRDLFVRSVAKDEVPTDGSPFERDVLALSFHGWDLDARTSFLDDVERAASTLREAGVESTFHPGKLRPGQRGVDAAKSS